MIVNSTQAMEMTFHFFLTTPENPSTRWTLLDTVESLVLRKLWNVAFDEEENGKGSGKGERELRWLEKAVEMLQTAGNKGKDDPLVPVCLACKLG
jgi:hypothetical protein